MGSMYFDRIRASKMMLSILSIFDFVRTVSPSRVVFLFTYFLCVVYSLDSLKVWRVSFDFNSTIFYTIAIICCSVFSISINKILKSPFSLLFQKNTKIVFYELLIITAFFLISFVFKSAIFLKILFFSVYFYNIAYLYNRCNAFKLEDKELNSLLAVACVRFFLLSGLSIVFIIDPLILTSILCAIPFYVSVLIVRKKIDYVFLIYRVSFFIILFFLTSTIFPYFFLVSLILMWLGKFYYYFKHGVKYPSFFNSYDKS